MQKERERSKDQALLQELLRKERIQAGLTQVDLAKKLGRHQSYVSKFETGERRLDLVELREVCWALGIALTTLVKRFEKGFE